MGSMIFSTVGMFTPAGVEVLALAVCVILTVVSTRAVKKDAAAQKKRREARQKRRRNHDPADGKKPDQLDTLYRAGILTREEYEEKKQQTRRRSS